MVAQGSLYWYHGRYRWSIIVGRTNAHDLHEIIFVRVGQNWGYLRTPASQTLLLTGRLLFFTLSFHFVVSA